MTKAELESKHLAELHALAEEAGIPRYRMLPRGELIEKLAGANDAAEGEDERGTGSERRRQRERSPRPPRQGRERRREPRREQQDKREPQAKREPQGKRDPQAKPTPSIAPATTPPSGRPKRKRRRRWGRRRKGVRVHDLLLPSTDGRQAIVYCESRTGCTALLREVAADLSDASNGPDPIAVLVDPSPEELADWKREAPKAELVSAGKARHAEDAIGQARARADAGEAVIVLIDSLTRFVEAFGSDAGEARELFDAGLGASGGTLTVVAALERPA